MDNPTLIAEKPRRMECSRAFLAHVFLELRGPGAIVRQGRRPVGRGRHAARPQNALLRFARPNVGLSHQRMFADLRKSKSLQLCRGAEPAVVTQTFFAEQKKKRPIFPRGIYGNAMFLRKTGRFIEPCLRH